MSDPDRKLAGKARHGDRGALGTLYERYRRRLFGFLLRSVGDRAGAEDTYQEVWVKVMQAIERYDPNRAEFRTWLFQIAANAAIDRARREAVRSRREVTGAGSESDPASTIDLAPHPGPDPERAGLSRLAGRAIAAALDALPTEQCIAVLLRHQQGLTFPELAQVLGIPEGTAKTRVHRATLVLRDSLKEWSDD